MIASFGVGELIVENSTHTYYAWHRHACGSDDPSTYYMNFSDSCVTPNDNSIQNMLTSDITWFIKPSKEECPNHWLSSISLISSPLNEDNNNNDDDKKNRLFTLEAVLIILCILFGTLNIILFRIIIKMIYYPTRNSSSTTRNSLSTTINDAMSINMKTQTGNRGINFNKLDTESNHGQEEDPYNPMLPKNKNHSMV